MVSQTNDHQESDDRLPDGGGLDPEFDPLGLAESYINDVLEALDIRPSDRRTITRQYWLAMQQTYKLHRTAGPPEGVEREEWLHEHFDTLTAFTMSELQSRYGQAQVPY